MVDESVVSHIHYVENVHLLPVESLLELLFDSLQFQMQHDLFFDECCQKSLHVLL